MYGKSKIKEENENLNSNTKQKLALNDSRRFPRHILAMISPQSKQFATQMHKTFKDLKC